MDTFETTVYTSVLITCFVLGAVFIFAAITIYRNQRRHYLVQRSHFLAEIELLEQERTRIARDLHDELGPMLTVTDIQLSEVLNSAGEAKHLVLKAQANVQTVLERLGGIARNLTPGPLAVKGLDYALREYLGQVQATGKLAVHYEYLVEPALTAERSLQVFRMVQELVTNAVKHSGANELTVHIKSYKRKLYIFCRDNGKGIGRDILDQPRAGLGLSSLHSRVKILGGSIMMSSNQGTDCFIALPLTIKDGTAT
jgi:signal transduction histidine kinase